MAFSTIYCIVLAPQREVCLIVIEMIHTYGKERFFIVTFGAIASKFIIVYIFVAGDTIINCCSHQILKDDLRFNIQIMAIFTVHTLM